MIHMGPLGGGPGGRFMKRIAAAVLALTVPSCSFVFTSGPGAVGNPPVAYPECTESMTWPIIADLCGVAPCRVLPALPDTTVDVVHGVPPVVRLPDSAPA